MMHNIETWGDLLDVLRNMMPEQLQKPQIIPPSCGSESGELGSVIAIGTVATMFNADDPTRSSYDNGHHPEDVVLLTDMNQFGEDGAIAEDLLTGERIFPVSAHG